ncbi:MAG: hypothetical protein N2555_00455 [Endomicrobia bacterium]|nr:hypothetical protein [Endomicrobiia bacterium]
MQTLQVLCEGKDGIGNNPAGCGMYNKKSFSFNNTFWRLKENLTSLSLFLPKRFSNLGFKFKYSNLGETELVDEELTSMRKESLYSLFFHTSFGKEVFTSGLYCGIDLGGGKIKLDRDFYSFGFKFGIIYVLSLRSAELHFGCLSGVTVTKDSSYISGIGLKYFLPEYRTFLAVSYNKNFSSFITTNIEAELLKNFIIITGYEVSTEKNMTCYSSGMRFIQRNFDISLGVRQNQDLGWTVSVGITIK